MYEKITTALDSQIYIYIHMKTFFLNLEKWATFGFSYIDDINGDVMQIISLVMHGTRTGTSNVDTSRTQKLVRAV